MCCRGCVASTERKQAVCPCLPSMERSQQRGHSRSQGRPICCARDVGLDELQQVRQERPCHLRIPHRLVLNLHVCACVCVCTCARVRCCWRVCARTHACSPHPLRKRTIQPPYACKSPPPPSLTSSISPSPITLPCAPLISCVTHPSCSTKSPFCSRCPYGRGRAGACPRTC